MNKTEKNLVAEYIKLHNECKKAEIRLKEIEKSLKQAINEGDEVVVDGYALKHIAQDRRSFDAIALKDLVSPSLFKKITEVSVKATAVDSAIELGAVDAEVIESVTEFKHSSYLKVLVK